MNRHSFIGLFVDIGRPESNTMNMHQTISLKDKQLSAETIDLIKMAFWDDE